nr:reverse transcriptase domain-containing protein [Tanacetum cinerariifolium]
ATNIILQGLSSDIYLLVNHHRVAKELLERIQLLMQGYSYECSCLVFELRPLVKWVSIQTYSLLENKDKLFELAKIPLSENCSAMLLKKLPKKLRDPGKFLIPCDFLGMDVCHALADLGASINLIPFSIWKKLSLPELTPTRMNLELADRSITRPKGVSKDVFVKVGKFHFLTDFVVVDFEADPRVPLILGRSFLRTGRALIDVYGEEITLRVNDEVVTFNLNQTTRYSFTYDDLSVNRIDVIDVVREEYAQEILSFFKNSSGDNPTSTSEPIISDSSPSLTLFEGSDFILEEIEAYLKDDSISSEIDHVDCDPEGDIYLIENLLNDDPFQLLLIDLNSWVSPIHCVPKKGGITIVDNENNELIPTRLVTGPFTITKVFPYGTVKLSQPDGPNFKVNGHRVKHYFGGDVPQLVVPDL